MECFLFFLYASIPAPQETALFPFRWCTKKDRDGIDFIKNTLWGKGENKEGDEDSVVKMDIRGGEQQGLEKKVEICFQFVDSIFGVAYD